MRWLIALVLIASCAFGKGMQGESASNLPAPRRPLKEWLNKRYEVVASDLETRDLAAVETVFIGDSITQGWLNEGRVFWDESFSGALNLGVSGDRTEHVLYRLTAKADGGSFGHLDDPRIKPHAVILMIGTNNLFKHDADQIVKGIIAVRNRLAELEPQTKIILCSVLPTADDERNRGLVIPVNTVVQNLDGVLWLDLYNPMVDGQGVQRNELFKDQVHLNTEGYRVWHERLKTLMNREGLL